MLRILNVVVLSTSCLAFAGCGSGTPETGSQTVKAEGQDAGEKASMDAMKAMMKSGGGASDAPAKK